MTLLTTRTVLASLAAAFVLAAPSAHAFVYNNPPTSTNAITTSGSRCTGAALADLGGTSGTGSAPAWTTLAWAYLDASNLPANYNDGSYCIDATRTITVEDGGGGGAPAAAYLALGGGGNTTSWDVTYTLHSGSGTTASGGMYSLTYTPANPVPTATLSASPSSISSGSSSVLTWNSANATSCTGTGFATGNATSGSVSVTPANTTTYSVSCIGAGGTSPAASATVSVSYTAPPAITSFTVTPSTASSGSAVTISWSATNAEYCSSTQFDTEGAISGSKTVNPTTTTTYTITCTGPSGTGTGTWQYRSSDLTDLSCPWTDMGRPYGGMPTCQQTPLTGSSCTNPPDKHCKVNSSGGGNGASCIVATDVYYCAVSGPTPSVSESRTVNVSVAAPTADLTATPDSITNGGASTLSWTSTNATSCVGTGFLSNGATSGSVSVSPTSTTQYLISCTAGSGSSGSGAWESNSWWTGGTQTVIYGETVHDNGQQDDLCPNAAANAGYSAWNEEFVRYPNRCGDAGCDLAQITCYGVSGPTGTTNKPAVYNGGLCTSSTAPGCRDTTYRRSSVSATGGGTVTDTATVNVAGLTASCSASPQAATVGQTVTWTVNASGGSGSYLYEWSGTDSLTGTSASIQKTYATGGAKTASVTVFSPHIASAEVHDRFAFLSKAFDSVLGSLVSTAHALMSGTCGGSFTGGGDTDCPGTVGDTGGGTGGYDYVTVQCDADSDPTDGVVTVGGPTATLTNNGPITSGNAATLTWGSTGATSCTGTGFNTGGATSGSVSTGVLTNPPQPSYNYSVSCSGAVANTTVSLTNPTAYILATPDRVNVNGSTALTWSAAQVTSCTVTGTDGYSSGTLAGPTIATTTPVSRTITKQTTFTITCDGAAASDNVVVNVVPRFEEF